MSVETRRVTTGWGRLYMDYNIPGLTMILRIKLFLLPNHNKFNNQKIYNICGNLIAAHMFCPGTRTFTRMLVTFK